MLYFDVRSPNNNEGRKLENIDLQLIALFFLGLGLIAIHVFNVKRLLIRDYIEHKNIKPKTKIIIAITTISVLAIVIYVLWLFFGTLFIKSWCEAWPCN